MQKIVSVLSAIFAISAGIIVLLGYFLLIPPFPQLRSIFSEWAVVVGGMAVIAGIGNLIFVHWDKMRTRQKGSGYSALLLLG